MLRGRWMDRTVLRGLALLAAAALEACGPTTSHLSDGSYRSATGPPSTLGLDLANHSATLRFDDASVPAIAMSLEAVAEKDWPHDCFTQFSSSIVESQAVTPDPLRLVASVSSPELLLASPRLDARCGGTPGVQLVGTTVDGVRTVAFTRQ